MQFTTINEIVSIFKTLANNHPQIHTWNFGGTNEISSLGQESYPIMWMDMKGSEVSERTNKITFTMYIFDVQRVDQSNEIHTLSDCHSVALDIIAQLKDPKYFNLYLIQENIQLTQYREALPNVVNGWSCDITFDCAFEWNRCQVPTN